MSNIEANTSSIVKNAGISISGQIFFILSRFAIGIMITRTIGPESFGLYILAISVIASAEVLSLLGMENTIIKFVSEYHAKNDMPRLRGMFYGGLSLVLISSTVFSIGIYLLADVISINFFHKPELSPVLKIMLLSIPFSTLMIIFIAALQGLKLIKYKVLIQRIEIPILRLVLITLVTVAGYKLKGIAWVYVIASFSGLILAVYYLRRKWRPILQKGKCLFDFRRMSSFSMPLLFTIIFNRIMSGADIIIMGFFLPAKMIGIYGIATRIIPLIIMPQTAVNVTFAPMISRLHSENRRSELEQQFKIVTRQVLITSLPIFALIILFSKQLMGLYGPDFVYGYKALIVLCIGQMINAAAGSVGYMLMMSGKPFANLINSGLLCSGSILLNLYLIPKYGIMGAAIANLLAVSFIQVLRLTEIWFFFKIHPYRFDDLKPIVSCIASFAAIMLLFSKGINTNQPLMILLTCFIFLVCYSLFLYFLKLSPEDHMLLAKIKNKFSS